MTAIIDYRFNNIEYLEQAFTHRSVSSEPRENYERLEFLGDAVIDIIISRELMRNYPDGDEGLLTKKRAALVRQSFLSIIGNILDIMDYLIVEPNVDLNNEKVVNKQRANLVEALIGAIYLDGGIKPAKKMIINTIWKYREEAWKAINYKGQLIEYCHSNNLLTPQFNIVESQGPEHEKTFIVKVVISPKQSWEGVGSTKKSAEQDGAQRAMNFLLGS